MGELIYAAIASLDGYVADAGGKWDWSAPDEEVHRFINDLQRPIGTHLYGRQLYGVLVAWETIDDEEPVIRDFAEVWRAADKIVYSRSLPAPSSERTRIEREFDPGAVERLKAASDRDLLIGGPQLAAQALAAGLVDECHLFLAPVVVGAGKRALPADTRADLRLQDERPFANGTVYLRYAVT